jgi:hypothetical protein
MFGGFIHTILPTSTFKKHSLQNDWVEGYMKLSGMFDAINEERKKHQ